MDAKEYMNNFLIGIMAGFVSGLLIWIGTSNASPYEKGQAIFTIYAGMIFLFGVGYFFFVDEKKKNDLPKKLFLLFLWIFVMTILYYISLLYT